jgi:hypothetical protein
VQLFLSVSFPISHGSSDHENTNSKTIVNVYILFFSPLMATLIVNLVIIIIIIIIIIISSSSSSSI